MFKKDDNKLIVEIKTVTWQKDSHGLFDYENTNHKIQKFIASESCCLNQKNEEIKIDYDLAQELTSIKDDSISLLNLTITRNSALIQKNPLISNLKKNQQQQYLIVRSLKNNEGNQKGYQIQIGDIIKLGRIDFKVIEMKGNMKNLKKVHEHIINQEQMINSKQQINNSCSQNMQEETEKQCRICYENNNSCEDCEPGEEQFVELCQCKGSCRFIHLICLKRWIGQKPITKKEGNIIRYKMQKFECELCKSPMPLVFTQNGQKFTLLDIERPQGEPYIILEHKEQNKDNNNNNNNSNSNNNEVKNENNQNTSLYVIKFNSDNNMTAKLGRGHSCEVRISDISVSRFHAKINYNADNDEFLLIDNNSKFGTLVLIQKPLTLKQERIAIQVGRTVITMFLKHINIQSYNFIDKKQINFSNKNHTKKITADFENNNVIDNNINLNNNNQIIKDDINNEQLLQQQIQMEIDQIIDDQQ